MNASVYTIGFTKKDARRFFSMLRQAGVKRVIDVRLNNVSQLSGFAKKADLEYFLAEISGIEYRHVPELAPTQDILDAYKKQKGDWKTYEQQFRQLMVERKIEQTMPRDVIDGACLLCSEDKPHFCHRRLVAEYLQDKWRNGIHIEHLV